MHITLLVTVYCVLFLVNGLLRTMMFRQNGLCTLSAVIRHLIFCAIEQFMATNRPVYWYTLHILWNIHHHLSFNFWVHNMITNVALISQLIYANCHLFIDNMISFNAMFLSVNDTTPMDSSFYRNEKYSRRHHVVQQNPCTNTCWRCFCD